MSKYHSFVNAFLNHQNLTRFLSSLLSLGFLSCHSLEDAQISIVDSLTIEVKDSSREYFFTNKIAGTYYGETNSQSKNGWQGWTVSERKIFNDYSIKLDSDELTRLNSVVHVSPHKLFRKYSNDVAESFCVADSLDLLLLEFRNLSGEILTLDLHKIPAIMNCTVKGGIGTIESDNFSLQIQSDTKIKNIEILDSDCRITIQADDEIRIAITLDAKCPFDFKQFDKIISQKKTRIERLLNESYVKTNDERFNKALAWNKVTLDALITHQGMKGIYAGLPWFNNYWGRDTFISLPGATFTQGFFNDAKDILLAFAKEQDKNPSSKFYGRIPNRITLNEKIYNTTDGTPWFVIQAFKYIKVSGDTDFTRKIYPTIVTAIQGALKNYVDKNYFLTHAEAETWMDAVGPKGPWSPRGNRANDIQTLWYQQLKFSSEIAKLNQDNVNYRKWSSIAQKLKGNTAKFFINKSEFTIYDHINKDNTFDKQIRPNQFFLLNETDFFDSHELRLKILANAMSRLVFPYGVLSLSQEDDNFHPYHHHKPYYVQDAAYHNGIIWTWNFGPVITSLLNFHLSNLAFGLTEELTRQTLEAGCVGSLSELTDAFPRKDEKHPRLSGTFTQAWSMAEFIRNFYDDYLGIEKNALENTIYLLPSLPDKLNDMQFRTRMADSYLKIRYLSEQNTFSIEIDGDEICDSIDIGISFINKLNVNFLTKFVLKKNEKAALRISHLISDKAGLNCTINGVARTVNVETYKDPSINSELYRSVKFAVPKFNKNWKSLKEIGYDILSNSEIKYFNPEAKMLLSSAKSRKQDFGYDYPLNQNFKAGILNIEKFELRHDEQNYYFNLKFENLHDPGWHPEYGFQLTLAAIAIQTSGSRSRTIQIGLNSDYQLPPDREFNFLILVGGGIEVRDLNGKSLAVYIPEEADVKNLLGNVTTKTISFSLPKKLLGAIDLNSKVTLLIGAQDDHGGAGIGEFRTVGKIATEWEGGGKENPKAPNAYQIIFIN
ncbi:MAG: hypothetical protein KJ666_09620 [Bacteroidetes bacterium]|nr:hypothetical protein [Bacteroidota bacterium]